MQTRYRAAATALLLTATAGMAATGGAAEASGTHHAHAKAAKSLVITIRSKASGPQLSQDTLRPGKTIFKVRNVDGKASKGLIQVFRLKKGYDFTQASQDFPALFADPPTADSIAAVNRIDDNVVFYGGMEAKGNGSKVAKWAVNINKAGTYYVVNFDKQTLTTFTAKGKAQKRSFPSRDGFINAKSTKGGGNTFVAGKHNPPKGWMSTKNNAAEPHFVDIEQVKKGTTNSDLTAAFQGQGNPFVKGGAATDTGVISPGHKFLWSYHLKKGRYGVMCFWPSKDDGMPHAIMGMHIVTRLR
ncbi:MAG TPA: hypothetical protein VFM08_17240 [Nocardioides sp.]|jgi:hypothetical protein|nr:hypothetical protein [Nocardioides sp.]